MKDEYLSKLTNKRITEILLNKENISPLEELINKERHNYNELFNKEKKLDRGKKVDKCNLPGLLAEIKPEVNAFLGVSGIATPNIKYFSFFLGLEYGRLKVKWISPKLCTKHHLGRYVSVQAARDTYHYRTFIGYNYEQFPGAIELSKRLTRLEIIPIIGHEYAHSVQVQKWDLSEYEHIKEFSYLEEGHATGVEKYMSIFYMKKENNSAFLYPSTVKNLFNFAEVYLWICKELGVKYKKSLISDKIHKKLSPNQKGITKMPIAHSLGNTFFCLHEATKGDKIYSDVIHRRFEPGLVK